MSNLFVFQSAIGTLAVMSCGVVVRRLRCAGNLFCRALFNSVPLLLTHLALILQHFLMTVVGAENVRWRIYIHLQMYVIEKGIFNAEDAEDRREIENLRCEISKL